MTAPAKQPWHEPWREDLRLEWPTEARFYRGFPLILERLKEENYLRGFSTSGDQVVARLRDRHEVSLGLQRLRISRSGGPVTEKIAGRVMAIVLEHMQPAVARWLTHFAHLYPLSASESFEELCKLSTRRVVVDAEAFQASDYAVLMDGEGPSGRLSYQIEFGVIREQDVMHRMTRWGNRMGGGRGQMLPPDPRYAGPHVPPLSLFTESTWSSKGKVPQDEVLEWSEELAGLAEQESRWLISQVASTAVGEERLAGEDNADGG